MAERDRPIVVTLRVVDTHGWIDSRGRAWIFCLLSIDGRVSSPMLTAEGDK